MGRFCITFYRFVKRKEQSGQCGHNVARRGSVVSRECPSAASCIGLFVPHRNGCRSIHSIDAVSLGLEQHHRPNVRPNAGSTPARCLETRPGLRAGTAFRPIANDPVVTCRFHLNSETGTSETGKNQSRSLTGIRRKVRGGHSQLFSFAYNASACRNVIPDFLAR